MTISGSIRYTSDQVFVISKGHSVKTPPGWGQMVGVASRLVQAPEYCGQAYSNGDSDIYQCAHGNGSTGNAYVWRKAGTNHHLIFVVNQIANQFGFLP
ncbi:MAG: hypothetical protein EON58_18085 [Alphaproteobacteria bacterium]|nr:MAG: hypothetical protein EON58_18085 [Alphaproteobacteria bacterium]